MNSLKIFLTKYSVIIFFIFVFAISWSAIYIIAGPDGFPINQDQAMVMGMAILLGPVTACIILTGLTSGRSGFRELLSRLFKWRAGAGWYAAALLIAPLSTAVILALFSLFSSEFQPNIVLSVDKLNLIISGIIGGSIVGLFEELGWTGFAIPRLKRIHGTVSTGVIVGIIWGAWHFPLFWEVNSFRSLLLFVLLIVRLFSWLPPYRILMVWIYNKTESLFLIILMHLSLVATLIVMDPIVAGEDLIIYILTRAILLWAIVGAIMLTERKTA